MILSAPDFFITGHDPEGWALVEWAGADPLEAEMFGYAQAAGLSAAAAQLVAMGAAREAVSEICGAGDMGLVRVSEEGGRWLPEPTGARRLVLAVRGSDGRLLDLVALSSGDPDRWSLRTGLGPVLGVDVLEEAALADPLQALRQAQDERRVRIYARPLDLLAHHCDGICVLDWTGAALTELRLAGGHVTLLADDAPTAAKLREMLMWGGLPEVRAVRESFVRPQAPAGASAPLASGAGAPTRVRACGPGGPGRESSSFAA